MAPSSAARVGSAHSQQIALRMLHVNVGERFGGIRPRSTAKATCTRASSRPSLRCPSTWTSAQCYRGTRPPLDAEEYLPAHAPWRWAVALGRERVPRGWTPVRGINRCDYCLGSTGPGADGPRRPGHPAWTGRRQKRNRVFGVLSREFQQAFSGTMRTWRAAFEPDGPSRTNSAADCLCARYQAARRGLAAAACCRLKRGT